MNLAAATKICRDAWPGHPFIMQVLKPGVICLRVRPLGPQDKITLEPVLQQASIQLAHVKLARDRSRHPVGYCLVYRDGAVLYHAVAYCAVCYSQPLDLRFREPSVQYNDQYLRLIRFGAEQYDWFLGCRRKTDTQVECSAAALAQQRHVGTWREGA